MKEEYITQNEEETIKLGEEFAKKIKPKDIVFLMGNLGSGKTAFVKGVAKGLGIKTRIISPTFVVARTHTTNHKKIKTLYHLDLYRLEGKNDLRKIGIDDFFNDEFAVTLIEWPENANSLVNEKIY
jgi:tRNA threonylcarbamoyladenosine biosynthesis protein TsaE